MKTMENLMRSAFMAGFDYAQDNLDFDNEVHPSETAYVEGPFEDQEAEEAYQEFVAWWNGVPTEDEPDHSLIANRNWPSDPNVIQPADMHLMSTGGVIEPVNCNCGQFSRRHTVTQHETFDRRYLDARARAQAASSSTPR